MAQKRGMVFVISGPSGAGKTTVCRLLVEKYGLELSTSATTREPRDGEENGREYFFVTHDEFDKLIADGELLEHSEHFGNCYGTPRQAVLDAVEEGRILLLEIDVNGMVQVMEKLPEAFCIFLTAPSDGENEQRLRDRSSEDEDAIQIRLQRYGDVEKAIGMEHGHHVINDDLNDTVDTVYRLIQTEAQKRNGC
jgi:guanylate kinase